MELKPLTLKHRKFVEALLVNDRNVAKAAQVAGFKAPTGYFLMRQDHIKAEINRRERDLGRKFHIDADELMSQLAKKILANEKLSKFKKINPEDGSLYWDWTGATEEELSFVNGLGTEIDNIRAIEAAAKLLGLMVDKKEISGPKGGPIEISDQELARRIAFTLAKVE